MKIAVLHPGEMGSAIAQALDGPVVWVPDGRSEATRSRALVPEADFVDGGIIGPPPTVRGSTRLYLSGDSAPAVAALFADTIVDARVVSDASALKMAYGVADGFHRAAAEIYRR
jgi:hypothetical protein